MGIDISVISNQTYYQTGTAVRKTEKRYSDADKVTRIDSYEHSSGEEKKATYSPNKMSESDRAAIVEQMKQDIANRQNQLSSLVSQMLQKQAGTDKLADMFSPENLANVTEEDIEKAKEDISENGYWGINQTSKRFFDFAKALAGDDVEKMKKMEEAMEKGFSRATASWGKELPTICKDTIDAAKKLFEEYYNSKTEKEED